MTTDPPHAEAARASIIVVTGVSGAGKSTVLRSLEDLGYFCIDNLPTLLAPDAVSLCAQGGIERVALGVDVRASAFLGKMGAVLDALADGGKRRVEVVFCDASDEAILRRFSETRRPHALASEGTGAFAVLDGVRLERERLSPLRARATRVIDTTHLSVHELRRNVFAYFGPASGNEKRMVLRFESFGFKYGTPVDADLVLDVRFLENPYFVPDLRRLPGTDPRVKSFVMNLAETTEFLQKTEDLLRFVVPKYEREGKSYLTVAIGCTGGRHRSVVVTEELATRLGGAIVHRDVGRESSTESAGSTGRHNAVEELTMQLSPLPAAVDSRRGGG